jgi:hypothetical protein
MDFTHHTVLLSVSTEKEKQDLQKQIDNYNLLISNNMSFIKNKQKEPAKNRKQVKQLKYKLDEFVQKDPFISMNYFSSFSSSSSSSSSTFLLLNLEELPINWTDEQMRDFIIKEIIKDNLSFMTAEGREDYPKNIGIKIL